MGIIDLARGLRRKETEAEKLLWKYLRNRRLEGKKFFRQHPIYYKNVLGRTYFFVADFYCAECNLVIELDGPIHDFRKEYDEQRDLIINEKEIKVLRIENEELKNIQQVLEKIKKHFSRDSPPAPL